MKSFNSAPRPESDMGRVAEQVSKFRYPEAHAGIEQKKIKETDFVGHYSSESLARDREYVEKRKAQFATDTGVQTVDKLSHTDIRKVSECAEFLIIEGIDKGWFPDCTVMKTSDYDDIANGVDCILERKKGHDPAAHLGLAIDVTCGQTMEKKLTSIKEAIDKGVLPRIKYFKSGNFKGAMDNLPKVVAAVDVLAIDRIFKSTAQGEDISKHHIRVTLLKQFEMQLAAFEGYTRGVKPELTSHFSTALHTVRSIIRELEQEMKKYDHILQEHPTLIKMKAILAEQFPSQPSKLPGRILRSEN